MFLVSESGTNTLESVLMWRATKNVDVGPGELARQWYSELKPEPFGTSQDNRSQVKKALCTEVVRRAKELYHEIIADADWSSNENVSVTLNASDLSACVIVLTHPLDT